MKLRIVADRERGLHHGAQRKAQFWELQDSIKAKHRGELAKAGLLQRLALRWGMATEERRKIESTPGSLYARRVDVAKSPSNRSAPAGFGFWKSRKIDGAQYQDDLCAE